jgi:pyruvate-ferredoxin/flavodoxin oxidoreductase
MSEIAVIYPITPSSPMGEFVDQWAAQGKPNLWGSLPKVVQMQSEGGAAGAVHGALQVGSLVTTFTASQGLLLMLPNMYKIAGEQLPFVMHVAARTIATHALSIFGDHSDVMSARQTGWLMLGSRSVQEAQDLAAISHAATLEASLPVMHFFDGFRTSHEVNTITPVGDDVLRSLMSTDAIAHFRGRGLSPDAPAIRGTAQNPDVFFQAREAANPAYDRAPGIVQDVMDRFAQLTGRAYQLCEYAGHPEATHVLIAMGSGAATCEQVVRQLADAGEKVGVVNVRLYRPLPAEALLQALPSTVQTIGVLDRTKEPGAPGEPLYLDVVAAIDRAATEGSLHGDRPTVVGGRYGLSSKEFTPGMVHATLQMLQDQPRHNFTVGILDDVTHTSVPWREDTISVEGPGVHRALFYGLGSDGTVGANKNTIKIIGEQTDNFGQGYFVYDSKKSGAQTVSHVRFGPEPIEAPYLIHEADFVACHQFIFLDRFDVLEKVKQGGTFLLNAPYGPADVWDQLPGQTQQTIIDKQLAFYCIDAMSVAREAGMGGRINTVMQACFFGISGVLPADEAIAQIKVAIKKTYGRKGEEIVRRNYAAVDSALEHLHRVEVPDAPTSDRMRPAVVPADAPDFVQQITARIMAGEGDLLPVSTMPADGTWPTGTTKYEKRGIAEEIPIWDPDVCIQCNKCALVCPHATIRVKTFDPAELDDAPDGFQSRDYRGKEFKGMKYTVQVAPDDCTGCHLCVMVCPAKNRKEPRLKAINMRPRIEHLQQERANWDAFVDLPEPPVEKIVRLDAKGSQFHEPLFEFSGACAGCGETPYIKLLTQLFGSRMLIANATGCSSIYGGNLPTTPYTVNDQGRGPAWSNSLFEDNAEYGYGMRLAVDAQRQQAAAMLKALNGELDADLVARLTADRDDRPEAERRADLVQLRDALQSRDTPDTQLLLGLLNPLIDRSVWIIGGDGWAYDIGYGGLDHVLAQREDVNVIVLDTEVYSNTGGQASKSTPLGAAAKFAAAGKTVGKKDLGLMAMSYGHVYVASVAFGANDNQTVKALQEAASYDGPSLVIAYSHCIAHGYDLAHGLDQQKLAVASGVWPLYRFDPRRTAQGLPPLQLDASAGKASVREYHQNETRFRMVQKLDPDRFAAMEAQSQQNAAARIALYKQLAEISLASEPEA